MEVIEEQQIGSEMCACCPISWIEIADIKNKLLL